MMQNNALQFKRQVTIKLADVKLQGALSRLQSRFVEGRSAVISEIADLPQTRDAAAGIRNRVLNDLEHWLLHFEREATDHGPRTNNTCHSPIRRAIISIVEPRRRIETP